MTAKVPRPSPLRHGIIFLSSLGIFCAILTIAARGTTHGDSVKDSPLRAVIGVEHRSPLTLTLVAGTGLAQPILEISHDGSGAILLSLPESWTLREVRGGPLTGVRSQTVGLGFVRWSVPPGFIASFDLPRPPSLLVHNASKIPLYLKLKRVDVRGNAVTEDGMLVTERPVRVW